MSLRPPVGRVEKFIRDEERVDANSRHGLIYHERSWRRKESGKRVNANLAPFHPRPKRADGLFFRSAGKLPPDVICHAQVEAWETIMEHADAAYFRKKRVRVAVLGDEIRVNW